MLLSGIYSYISKTYFINGYMIYPLKNIVIFEELIVQKGINKSHINGSSPSHIEETGNHEVAVIFIFRIIITRSISEMSSFSASYYLSDFNPYDKEKIPLLLVTYSCKLNT